MKRKAVGFDDAGFTRDRFEKQLPATTLPRKGTALQHDAAPAPRRPHAASGVQLSSLQDPHVRRPISDDDGSSSEEDSDIQPMGPDIPLEELERLRAAGVGPSGKTAVKAAREASATQYKRHSRHMPAEESAKRPVPRFREVLQVPKREQRDPRFDPGSGAYDKDRFMKQYKFLYGEVLPAEREQLKQQVKRAKTEEESAALKVELSRVQNRILDFKNRQQQNKLVQEVKAKEKETVKSGKPRYYTKKSELRKLMLIEKYKELEKSGKLEKFMEKRRKKNAAKDHKRVPRDRLG